ncbi:hypothetical protein BBJ29_010139 [Phytophthora kernoviae]|uniref:Uncharacterized protein n=1 Tax=Phytophthora kernoviae TaxID=325452 RepID=A0A421FN22_9STRA|nr:hypothetical protein BBJ29_010139 [Phytophthora kernoviae]
MTANWPSLRLHFTLKRSTMQVYGQSVFSMIANPTVSSDSSSVLYNTFATFDEGATSYNHTLVDGLAYVSQSSLDDSTATPSVSCVDSDSLPSVNSIVAPMKGSMGSDYFQKSCKNGTNEFIENLVEKSGFCPADDGIKSLAYEATVFPD